MSVKKNPTTPSGIEPATFGLVAQCFNQMRSHVSPFAFRVNLIIDENNTYVFTIDETMPAF
jgi:hypothetical protein